MATLIDKELFDYLSHLEEEVDKRISTSDNRSLQYLIHCQMADLIEAEKKFLRFANSNGTKPILSISPNGLPSVQSLNPDLEKMCELAKEEKSLSKVAQRFREGIKGKNKGEKGNLYVPVSEEEWSTEQKNYNSKELLSQIAFSISETEEGKFELSLREDLFLKGYDRHSKELPVLIREGKMKYHVVWNRLVEESEESFYVSNTALVLQGRPIKPSKKQFDDLDRFYQFKRRDYKSSDEIMPWIFWRSWTPIDYAQFLSDGTAARVAVTNSIFETLKESLGKQVNLKGIRRKDLEITLAFTSIPFENAPQTTPKEEDFYELDKYGKITHNKLPTEFDLIYTSGAEKVGTLEYFLPRRAAHFSNGGYGSGRYRNGYKFTLGGVKLHILGSAIYNESQFKKLQTGLKRIGKR